MMHRLELINVSILQCSALSHFRVLKCTILSAIAVKVSVYLTAERKIHLVYTHIKSDPIFYRLRPNAQDTRKYATDDQNACDDTRIVNLR